MPRSSEATREDLRSEPETPRRAGGRSAGPQLEKVTVNLTKRSVEALDKIVENTGDTKTDGINRALQVFAYIQEQLDRGASLYIKDPDSDQAERLTFL